MSLHHGLLEQSAAPLHATRRHTKIRGCYFIRRTCHNSFSYCTLFICSVKRFVGQHFQTSKYQGNRTFEFVAAEVLLSPPPHLHYILAPCLCKLICRSNKSQCHILARISCKAFLGHCRMALMDLLHCENDNFYKVFFFFSEQRGENCVSRTKCSLVSTADLLNNYLEISDSKFHLIGVVFCLKV